MAKFKVGPIDYSCESVGRPSVIEKHQQLTIVGPTPPFLKFLSLLLECREKKSFKAKTYHGKYKGKFKVIDIPNPRVVIIKLYDVELIK